MVNNRHSVILLFLLLPAFAITAQDLPKIPLDLDITFQHFTNEQGLFMATTRITQDHLGYLWFGTFAGLFRYDGYEFKRFFPRTGNPADSVSRIQGIGEDASGNIWFGQYGFGIHRLDRKTGEITNFRHHADDTTSLSANNIGGFFLDSRGFLWIAAIQSLMTNTVFLDRLDTRTGLVKRYRHRDGDVHSVTVDFVRPAGIGFWNPLVIDEDTNGDLWIAQLENGVVRYNRECENFTRFLNNPADPASLSSNNVESLTPGRDGKVWIFTRNGMNRFDPSTQSFTRFRHHRNLSNSLGDDACNAGFFDRSGRLWIAHQKGLDRYNPETGLFEHFRHDPDNPKTPSRSDRYLPVFEDDHGAIWFLAQGEFSAVNLFDPVTQSFQRYENSPYNTAGYHVLRIFSFGSDRSRCLWMGSGDGIMNKIHAGANRFYVMGKSAKWQNSLPGGRINDILESKRQAGIVWIASSEGLSRLDWRKGTVRNFRHDPHKSRSLYSNDIRAVDEDEHGNIWLCTKNGMDKLDASGNFTHFHHDPADSTTLSSNDIVNFCYDPKGYLWIYTDYCVLNRMDVHNGRVRRYRKRTGDSTSINTDMQITAAFVDRSGVPWIGTESGLNRFDHRTGHFSHLYKTVPLRIYEDRSGNFWIGSHQTRYNSTSKLQ